MYKFCSSPYDTVVIIRSGDIFPCLCRLWHTSPSIGNIISTPLIEIFNSTTIEQFRNSILDQSFKFCKSSCSKKWNLDTVDAFPIITSSKNLLPSTILLSIDSNCNLKCASCRSENVFSPTANPIAERILTQLNNDYKDHTEPVFIRCDGAGDIFASKAYHNFFNNVDLAKCFRFDITTNGNLLTKNLETIDRIKSQINSITISFDAATPETYKKTRGGKFESVIDGVKEMVSRGIRVDTQYVIQQQNYRELLDYKNLAKSLNVYHIAASGIVRWHHMTNTWWAENTLENNSSIDYNFLIPALQEFKESPNCSLDGELLTLLNNSLS